MTNWKEFRRKWLLPDQDSVIEFALKD